MFAVTSAWHARRGGSDSSKAANILAAKTLPTLLQVKQNHKDASDQIRAETKRCISVVMISMFPCFLLIIGQLNQVPLVPSP